MTGQDVLNITLSLLNRKQVDSVKYKLIVPNILTILQYEILQAEGSAVAPVALSEVTDTLQVRDKSARLIMPYGLAAQIALNEGLDTAAYFNDRYMELLRKIPRAFVQIEDVYGGIEGGE